MRRTSRGYLEVRCVKLISHTHATEGGTGQSFPCLALLEASPRLKIDDAQSRDTVETPHVRNWLAACLI